MNKYILSRSLLNEVFVLYYFVLHRHFPTLFADGVNFISSPDGSFFYVCASGDWLGQGD